MPSEHDLIKRYFSPDVSRGDIVLGVGDDAAVVQPPADMELVVTTDTLIEGVHFPGNMAPEALGHKALAVNLSDLAAMGADPAWVTLSITLPEADESWLEAFSRGFLTLAERYGWPSSVATPTAARSVLPSRPWACSRWTLRCAAMGHARAI